MACNINKKYIESALKDRTTPNHIVELKRDEIFVFGSNLSGIHGAGAARLALDKFGAKMNNFFGQQGQSYAIPTKAENVRDTLSQNQIKPFVNHFIDYAKKNRNLIFLVTEIGCGLAGHIPETIAPLFEDSVRVTNIHLPERFWKVLKDSPH